MFSKRGMEPVLEHVIFFGLNMLFFALLLVFVSRSAGGTLVYEQAYAKQVALLVDEARPNVTIKLDATVLMDVARQKGSSTSNMVSIDMNAKKVIVSLAAGGGYSYPFISDYNVEVEKDIYDGKYIVIRVTK